MPEYNPEGFRKRLKTLDDARQVEKDKDASIQSARRRLENALATLELHQRQLAAIPIDHTRPDHRRKPLYDAIEADKQEIQDAQSAVNKAENDFARARYEAKLQADRDALNQQHKTEELEHAKQQETLAKSEFGSRFISAGGTAESFEKAWPQMWQAELVRRASVAQPSEALSGHLANIREAL